MGWSSSCDWASGCTRSARPFPGCCWRRRPWRLSPPACSSRGWHSGFSAPTSLVRGVFAMPTPFDWQRAAGRRFFRAAVVFLSLGASGVMFSASAAAPQPASNPPASAEEKTNLRQALESRYEVLPVQGGIALKPRQPKAGIRTVEVTSDGVAVNGERVTARTLHDWLGADADLVLRLQGLSAAEQRQVFGLEGGAPAAAAPGAPAPAATPAAEPGDAAGKDGESEVSDETAAEETPEAASPSRHHGDRHGSGSR